MDDKYITGNEVQTSDFLRVLMALKKNIMEDLHVAELCTIDAILDDGYKVALKNNPSKKFVCQNATSSSFELNQEVLVIFLDTNPHNKDDKTLHSISYGIIIGNGSGKDIDDVQIDNKSVVSGNIARFFTMNNNYNASSNKLATKSDIPVFSYTLIQLTEID